MGTTGNAGQPWTGLAGKSDERCESQGQPRGLSNEGRELSRSEMEGLRREPLAEK